MGKLQTAAGALALVLVMVATAGLSYAQAGATEQTTVRTEVKRDHRKGPRHPSLQFLRNNRVFLRTQLDRLRLQTTVTHTGQAAVLDERWLRLQELANAIATAGDTVDAASARISQDELLASVAGLSDLDGQLGLMEGLVADQHERLQVLEQDFLGRQKTALVVLVRGLPARQIPTGISLTEDNNVLEVPLSPAQQDALRRGGVAQINHQLVEPRDHRYAVGFQGPGWQDIPASEVVVSAGRDRITFLELDLSDLEPAPSGAALVVRTWQR